jgi:hypothetical protein
LELGNKTKLVEMELLSIVKAVLTMVNGRTTFNMGLAEKNGTKVLFALLGITPMVRKMVRDALIGKMDPTMKANFLTVNSVGKVSSILQQSKRLTRVSSIMILLMAMVQSQREMAFLTKEISNKVTRRAPEPWCGQVVENMLDLC